MECYSPIKKNEIPVIVIMWMERVAFPGGKSANLYSIQKGISDRKEKSSCPNLPHKIVSNASRAGEIGCLKDNG